MNRGIVRKVNYVWMRFKVYAKHYFPLGYFLLIWYIGNYGGTLATKKYILKISK